MPTPRIAFFGTPELTIPILEALSQHGYTPSCIVTGPDRTTGRHLVLTPPAPKVWATEKNILVLQPEKITEEFVRELAQQPWDLFVVVAYGAILPEALITIPTYGTINVHYSLLPQYRGATPTEAAILHGDTQTGITIQHMVYKLDAGAILAQKIIPLTGIERTPTLRDTLNAEACMLLPETIKKLLRGEITPVPQDETQVSKCGKIKKEDGLIDIHDTSIQADRKFRAYYGWPGTYFFITHHEKQMRVKVTDAVYQNDTWTMLKVIPEGKKEMSFEDFKRGYLE